MTDDIVSMLSKSLGRVIAYAPPTCWELLAMSIMFRANVEGTGCTVTGGSYDPGKETATFDVIPPAYMTDVSVNIKISE